MKIAVDVMSIREDGSAGGATGFAIELIKGFAARQGVQVVVLCADWNEALLRKCLPGNVDFCVMTGNRKYTGNARIDGFIEKVRNRIKKESILLAKKVDVLCCPFSAATFKEKEIPTVSTILDIQHEFYPQFFDPIELSHRRQFYQNIVKNVERVVCISDYTKDTFCEKYGYPKERASTIYIAIQNRFDKKDDSILTKLNIEKDKYIVYPANFWEHKNHKLLLNAFAMYAHENKELKLVLTGNPLTQTDYYNELLRAMKIDDRTVITGYITNEELYSILSGAKGLIYPSLFEGFGIPVVEAMHLNKLIASSNQTSLPEIGCSAICYFDPRRPDDILSGINYIANNEMNDEICAEYAQKLKDYETEKMIDAYLEVFREVIDDKLRCGFDEELSGVYADSWSGKEILVKLNQKAGEKLKVRFSVPEFIKIDEKVKIEHNGIKKVVKVSCGDTVSLEEPVKNEYEEIKFTFSKTWSPKAVLKSEDERQLGVMVEEISVTDNGKTVNLKSYIN